MEDKLAIKLRVHGYHIYNNIWEAAVGEELLCEREPRNTKDRYAVIFASLIFAGLTSPANTTKFSHCEIN